MFFGLLSNCVALSDRSFPPELRSFEVTILGINSSRTRESWRKGKSASRQQPFIGRVLYTGRRSFHLRETRLAEPARRKERDKQVGARRGSEYLLPSGIPSLQRCLSLSLSLSLSFHSADPRFLFALFFSVFLPESGYKSSREPNERRTAICLSPCDKSILPADVRDTISGPRAFTACTHLPPSTHTLLYACKLSLSLSLSLSRLPKSRRAS